MLHLVPLSAHLKMGRILLAIYEGGWAVVPMCRKEIHMLKSKNKLYIES